MQNTKAGRGLFAALAHEMFVGCEQKSRFQSVRTLRRVVEYTPVECKITTPRRRSKRFCRHRSDSFSCYELCKRKVKYIAYKLPRRRRLFYFICSRFAYHLLGTLDPHPINMNRPTVQLKLQKHNSVARRPLSPVRLPPVCRRRRSPTPLRYAYNNLRGKCFALLLK